MAETQKILADFLLAGSPLRENGRVPRNDHENRKSGGHAVRVCAACALGEDAENIQKGM